MRLRDNAPPSPSVLLPGGSLLCVHATPSRNSDLRYIREKCKRLPRVMPLQVLLASQSWITRASSAKHLITDVIKYFPKRASYVFQSRDITNFSLQKCKEKCSPVGQRSRSACEKIKYKIKQNCIRLSINKRAIFCTYQEDINDFRPTLFLSSR